MVRHLTTTAKSSLVQCEDMHQMTLMLTVATHDIKIQLLEITNTSKFVLNFTFEQFVHAFM